MTDKSTVIILREEKQRTHAIDFIRRLDITARTFDVRISIHREKRSLDQNALFHGWCGILADHFGYDFEDMKETLKKKFMPPRYVEIDGETFEVRRSTANLKTNEMAELCTAIDIWAASEYAIMLPRRADLMESR